MRQLPGVSSALPTPHGVVGQMTSVPCDSQNRDDIVHSYADDQSALSAPGAPCMICCDRTTYQSPIVRPGRRCWPLNFATVTLLTAWSLGGCSSHLSEPTEALTFAFDFQRGPQGFVAGFADYPARRGGLSAHGPVRAPTSAHGRLGGVSGWREQRPGGRIDPLIRCAGSGAGVLLPCRSSQFLTYKLRSSLR